jgi:adenylate cyclase class 2
MNNSGKELEIKYLLADLGAVRERAISLGAQLLQERTHEINLRFDTPDGDLQSKKQVLRLRQDAKSKVTYKGPGVLEGGVRSRREIEFEVSDFNAARQLFENLGYEISLMYEKYRMVYELDGVQITLDEMPYGTFVELEGPGSESIKSVNEKLSLDWNRRYLGSYTDLFAVLRESLGFEFRDLSFENFEHLSIDAKALGLEPADRATVD